MNKAIPTANRPPKESTSDGLKAVAAEEEVDEEVDEELEVEVPEAELLSVPELLLLVLLLLPDMVLEVPLETAVPGRLTVALAARAWKFASVRVALAVGLSIALDLAIEFQRERGAYLTLMTMVIPFWQCFPWEQ